MLKGIVASVLASVLFGAIYSFSPWLAPLDGEQIFGWRVLLTLPFTTLMLLWLGETALLTAVWRRVCARPALALALLASAAMLGVQLWLFMWAPLHGRALPVSLGYFLLPLTMVLVGRVVYGERLSRAQSVTLGIETAVQNATLAIVIASSVLHDDALAIPGALYGVLMYAGGLAFAFGIRRFARS